MWRFLNLVLYFCIRKSYPNKQSDADHGNWNGCQLVTQKQGNSSNSLEFKEIYSYCRIMQYICNTQMAKQGIFCSELMAVIIPIFIIQLYLWLQMYAFYQSISYLCNVNKRENNKRCSTAFRNAESKKRRRL